MRLRRMAEIIDGKTMAQQIKDELKAEVDLIKARDQRLPHLTAILVGEDPASKTYVRNKLEAAKYVGITSETKRLPKETTEEELIRIINELNADKNVDGILVQLPVPEHMNEKTICNAVCFEKDVDGFNERNVGRLALDMKGIVPATPKGVIEMLRRSNIETFGKRTVVVGRSKHVAFPIAILMHADGRHETKAMDSTVTICHRYTKPEDLKEYCRMADIIIVAVGKPCLITKDMVKPGACIIDVGINRIVDENTGKSRLVGDVDFEEVSKVAGHITPVPGGVGPMTVAMVISNTVEAYKELMLKERQSGA